jgi:hypothetical protein
VIPPLAALALALFWGLLAFAHCRVLWWRIHPGRGWPGGKLPDRTSNEVRFVRDAVDKWIPTAVMTAMAVYFAAAAIWR